MAVSCPIKSTYNQVKRCCWWFWNLSRKLVEKNKYRTVPWITLQYRAEKQQGLGFYSSCLLLFGGLSLLWGRLIMELEMLKSLGFFRKGFMSESGLEIEQYKNKNKCEHYKSISCFIVGFFDFTVMPWSKIVRTILRTLLETASKAFIWKSNENCGDWRTFLSRKLNRVLLGSPWGRGGTPRRVG